MFDLLYGANLTNAFSLTFEQLAPALGDLTTGLPDDIRRPDKWPARELDPVERLNLIEAARSRSGTP